MKSLRPPHIVPQKSGHLVATSALHDAFYAFYASHAGLHNPQDMLYVTATKEHWAIRTGVSHMHEVTGSSPVTPTSFYYKPRNDLRGFILAKYFGLKNKKWPLCGKSCSAPVAGHQSLYRKKNDVLEGGIQNHFGNNLTIGIWWPLAPMLNPPPSAHLCTTIPPNRVFKTRFSLSHCHKPCCVSG